MSVMLPSPQASNVGTASPPTRRAVLPSVFAPSSPYEAESGSVPAPHESITMATKRPISVRHSRAGDDRDAGARADARRPRLDHPERVRGAANPARRLDPHVVPHHFAHE